MKVAIVTGASRGIGACVAEGLSQDGYAVILVARSAAGLERVAKLIRERANGTSCIIETFAIDIQDADAVNSMVSKVVSQYGRVDLLFNNAGIGTKGTLELSMEQLMN